MTRLNRLTWIALAATTGWIAACAPPAVTDAGNNDVVMMPDRQQPDTGPADTGPVDTGVDVPVMDVQPDVTDTGTMDATDAMDDVVTDTGPTAPPPVDAGATRCLISADCPSGTHCDLGQCIQDCNTDTSCTATGTSCSARARCLTSATPDQDPPPVPVASQLSVSPETIALDPTTTTFNVTLRATGHVRYRFEPSDPWLTVPALRGEFDNMLVVPVTVDSTMIPVGTSATLLRVFSTVGNGQVTVTVPPSVDGTFRGSIAYDSVVVPGSSPATVVPANLGTTRFGIWVHNDGSVRARVDSDHSLLWPASASGSAEGSGSLTGTRLDLRLFQLLDSTAIQPLFAAATPSTPAVPSPLPARPIGRELVLSLTVGQGGTLNGTAIERIYGLSRDPIEVHGTARLNYVIGDATPAFTLGTPPTMPGGPVRGVGTQPTGCAVVSDCTATAGTMRDGCELRHMGYGFSLHTFYQPTEGGSFALPSSSTGGTSPYVVSRDACEMQLGADLRADSGTAGLSTSCVNPVELQCVRYLAGTIFSTTEDARYQNAFNVARAWGETYNLLGNQAMVQAVQASYLSMDASTQMRQNFVVARSAYDAGLYRILDPRLLGELRAAPLSVVQGSIPGTTRANDRIALRRAADLLLRSADATGEVLEIDTARSSPAELVTLRRNATRDTIIYWISTAVLADLDSAWRRPGGSDGGVPEVYRLGTMMSNLDQRVLAMDPTYTPLGVARSYVPLLARASSTDLRTNFERMRDIASVSVMNARTRQDLATSASADYDNSFTSARTAIAAAASQFVSDIQEVCGSDFAHRQADGTYLFGTDDPTMSPNLPACGQRIGSFADAIGALRTAGLQVQAAQEAENSLNDQITMRAQNIMAVYSLRQEDVAFREANNDTIYALRYAQAAADATAAFASDAAGAVSGDPFAVGGALGLAALDAAATFASGALQAEQDRLANMNDMHAARTDLTVEYMNSMEDLKELMLQKQGLRIQTAIQMNEASRAMTQLATLRDHVIRAIDDYNNAVSDANASLQNDPSFRLQRDSTGLLARGAFLDARLNVYLALRALEYETNTDLSALARSVYEAQNVSDLENLSTCLGNAWNQWLLLVPSTTEYVTEISVRRDIFGITGPRMDNDTHMMISEGEQFRRLLFAQPYVSPGTGRIWPAIQFATTLRPDRGLFSSLVCNDRISTIEAQLVGPTGLGDNQAELQLLADGSGLLRSCDAPVGTENIVTWNLRPQGLLAPAIIQAGVNSYGTAPPNPSMLGYSVAQTTWILAIPDGSASPANRDVDTTHIDDIQIRVHHTAVAAGSTSMRYAPTCP